MVNRDGKRFVDEGEDMRNYTYAKFGKAILGQPGGVAWQVYDAKVTPLLRKEEYADDVVDEVEEDELEAEEEGKVCLYFVQLCTGREVNAWDASS